MRNRALRAGKIHGLVFDAAMFLGNLVFVPFVPRLGDEVADETAGILLVIAILTQAAGAWGKKPFLGPRLAMRPPAPSSSLVGGFMNILLFLHFILFSVIILFALALLDIVNLEGPGDASSNVWVPVSLIAGGLTTALVRSAAQPSVASNRARARPHWLEYAATGLLWVSASLITRIFWDGLMALIEPASGIGLSGRGFVLLVAVSLLYFVFYLPERYLFLVEDVRSKLTWVQMGVAMLPAVWLVMVG